MTPAEMHALADAFEERRAELPTFVEAYRARSASSTTEHGRTFWTALADEYANRLDELDRLALSAQVGEMQPPLTEGEARAMAGNR